MFIQTLIKNIYPLWGLPHLFLTIAYIQLPESHNTLLHCIKRMQHLSTINEFLNIFLSLLPCSGVLRNAGSRASEHHEALHRHSMPAQQQQQLRGHRASSYQQEMKERWSSDKSHSGNNLTTESRTTQLLSWQSAGHSGQAGQQVSTTLPAESIELQLQMQVVCTPGYNNNYRRINNAGQATSLGTATAPTVSPSQAAAGDDKTWL